MVRTRTDWKKLHGHLQKANLQVGQTLTLTAQDLRGIVGVAELPRFASRVTAWDPVMGKPGGLQGVMKSLKMFPVRFEWTGSTSTRPVLASVTIMRWGSV